MASSSSKRKLHVGTYIGSRYWCLCDRFGSQRNRRYKEGQSKPSKVVIRMFIQDVKILLDSRRFKKTCRSTLKDFTVKASKHHLDFDFSLNFTFYWTSLILFNPISFYKKRKKKKLNNIMYTLDLINDCYYNINE